jgi:hypothetical protein
VGSRVLFGLCLGLSHVLSRGIIGPLSPAEVRNVEPWPSGTVAIAGGVGCGRRRGGMHTLGACEPAEMRQLASACRNVTFTDRETDAETK